MPGGSDETGNSASAATNSGVVTPVAVVYSLFKRKGIRTPFQRVGENGKELSSYTHWEKGSQVTRRNMAFCFTRPASRCRTFILPSCLVVKIKITPCVLNLCSVFIVIL